MTRIVSPYELGNQPCAAFQPGHLAARDCDHCHRKVQRCQACLSEHHAFGRETCPEWQAKQERRT
jgi:hypothetical protein